MNNFAEINDLFEDLEQERQQLFKNEPKYICQYCGSAFYHELDNHTPCVKCIAVLCDCPIKDMSTEKLKVYRKVLTMINRCDIPEYIMQIDREMEKRNAKVE